MITQTDLDTDRQAIKEAEAKLAADQATFDAVQPHMNMIQTLEGYVRSLSAEVRTVFAELVKSIL